MTPTQSRLSAGAAYQRALDRKDKQGQSQALYRLQTARAQQLRSELTPAKTKPWWRRIFG